jgi:hypothetical protein
VASGASEEQVGAAVDAEGKRCACLRFAPHHCTSVLLLQSLGLCSSAADKRFVPHAASMALLKMRLTA